MIEYRFQHPKKPIEALSPSIVYEFLESVESLFTPRLSTRVQLMAYANKLHTKACLFSAYNDGTLVGILAVYANEAGEFYIPLLCVSPVCQKMGIAKTLMQQCLDYVRLNKGKRIQLEVSTENHAAITLYKRNGFMEIDESYNLSNVNKTKMVCDLKI